jgi:hypothetical protein
VTPDWRRALVRRLAWIGALLVVGLVLAVIGGEDPLGWAGWVLVGLALILVVALAFYEVGLSEDRDRERRGGGS